ncbi:MAG: DnaJ domain-containing protein [Acidobacteriia bacterium]|nr:DnaJ domain-containing protein [Terriglobia bacterium]
MSDRRTFYEVLEVEFLASDDQIRAAFRRLARERHPDRFQGPARAAAEKEFQAITEAYNVLSDATQRSRYDQALSSTRASQQRANPREVARALLAKAVGLANAGQSVDAKEYFAQAVAHDPDSAKAHHLFGVFLSKQTGGLEEALRHLDQAVKLEPNDVRVLMDASKLFARAKMVARAARFAQQAAQLSPGDPDIESWLEQLRKAVGGGGNV